MLVYVRYMGGELEVLVEPDSYTICQAVAGRCKIMLVSMTEQTHPFVKVYKQARLRF